ncbi:MAG: hypothetical protein ACLRQF_24290 [Thomasclavelia ramosa]
MKSLQQTKKGTTIKEGDVVKVQYRKANILFLKITLEKEDVAKRH